MKALKGISIVIVALVAIYIVLALMGPKNYTVTRNIKIAAPMDIVFEQTSLYANWSGWSHWSKMDPEAKYSIKDDNQQVGGSMSWDGTITGNGIMTTTEVLPNEKFHYEIEFIAPWYMAGKSRGGFSYEQEGDDVLLTWIDGGDIGFMKRPMMLMMDIETQIGPAFEQGLADIKKICEEMTESALDISETTVESVPMLYISESSTISSEAIGQKMGAAYGELMALVGIAGLEMASAPISITHKFSLEEMLCDFDAALTIKEIPEDLELSGRIQKGDTYSGKVLKTMYVGSYSKMMPTYNAIVAHIEKNGYEMNGSSWEEYIDDPSTVLEEELRTYIYFPVK